MRRPRSRRPRRHRRRSPTPKPDPIRTCIGCRRRADTAELVRVVCSANGRVVVGRHMPGRGAWLCHASPGCVDLAMRRHAFERALRATVDPSSIAQLRNAPEFHARLVGP